MSKHKKERDSYMDWVREHGGYPLPGRGKTSSVMFIKPYKNTKKWRKWAKKHGINKKTRKFIAAHEQAHIEAAHINLLAKDFHDAMLHALLRTQANERVHKIEYRTQEEMDAIYKHKGACWNTETAA